MLTKRSKNRFKYVLVVFAVFLAAGLVYKPVQKIEMQYIAYETESVTVSTGHASVPSTYGYDALSGDLSSATLEGYCIPIFVVNGVEILPTAEVSSNTYRYVMGSTLATNATAIIPKGTVDVTTDIVSDADAVSIEYVDKGTSDLTLSNLVVSAECYFIIENMTSCTIEIKLHYDDADFTIAAPGIATEDDYNDLSESDFTFPKVNMYDYKFDIYAMTAVNMIVYKAINVMTIGDSDGITVSNPNADGVTYVLIDYTANFDYDGLGEYDRDQFLGGSVGGVSIDKILMYVFVGLLALYIVVRMKRR